MAIILSKHLTDGLDGKRLKLSYIEAAIAHADWAGPALDRRDGVLQGHFRIRQSDRPGCTPPRRSRCLCHHRLLGPRSPATMIQTSYDPEADVAEINFGAKDAVYDGSQEVSPGIMLHLDTEGRVIGVEIEAVSLRMAGAYRVQPAKAEAAE
jgi:uncharacterized protein YuzE